MVSLIFSTCNRFDLFKDTIESLIYHNPELSNLVKHVYVLDDRSPYEVKGKIEKLINQNFPHKGKLISFNNSSSPYAYVEKLNFIQNITLDTKYTLFIEEDWRSLAPLNLTSHIQYLEDHPNLDQIVFSEHYWLQDEEVKEKTSINDVYWDHSKVETFKHTYDFKVGEDGVLYYIWLIARPIFTLNPTLNRNTLYQKSTFPIRRDYEESFSKQVNAKQILTKQARFVHTGANLSAEGTIWNN